MITIDLEMPKCAFDCPFMEEDCETNVPYCFLRTDGTRCFGLFGNGCPIVHEENEWVWNKDNLTYKCTKCGFEYSPKGYEDGTVDFPYNYCPHCGIKMKKSGR